MSPNSDVQRMLWCITLERDDTESTVHMLRSGAGFGCRTDHTSPDPIRRTGSRLASSVLQPHSAPEKRKTVTAPSRPNPSRSIVGQAMGGLGWIRRIGSGIVRSVPQPNLALEKRSIVLERPFSARIRTSGRPPAVTIVDIL